MRTLLVLSNVLPEAPGGRAARLTTSRQLLADRGWNVEVCHVPPPYRAHLPAPTDVLECCRVLRRRDVDVVLSMSEPPQLHALGLLVHELFDVPWIAHFRDPMCEKPGREPDSVAMHLRRRLERTVVDNATQVLWDDGIQIPDDYFERRYPEAPSDRWYKLPFIGFVAEEFERAPAREFEEFTVTYAGSFYEGWIEPYPFLEALGRYLDSPDAPADLTVRFYGDWNEEYQDAAVRTGAADVIETYGWVDHEDLIPILKGSDVLLHVGGEDPRNELNVPAKIYDYIGARVPMLAVVDPSFRVADVIRDNGLGLVASPSNVEALEEALGRLASGRYEYDPDETVFDRFAREHRIAVLANVLEQVAEGAPFVPGNGERQRPDAGGGAAAHASAEQRSRRPKESDN